MCKLPKHLEKILRVSEHDKTTMSGRIVCECGCEKFGVKYFGEEMNEDGEEYPVLTAAEFDEKTALAVKAVCAECGMERLLFDFAKHGYDGLICGDGISVPDTELKTFTDGDEDDFKIEMTVEFDDEGQFLEEIVNDPPEGMSFTPDDRSDIWSWAVIELTGAKSGKKIKLVDEELA
ncbi:MAG: hypothetical protein NC299_01505 [Lachnospiraceae bacterium]|nr:hypothetical protein [Ruminococcus sp.]MCM1274026.1 hypothetical protein [Lachnospiraceae bacterium]